MRNIRVASKLFRIACFSAALLIGSLAAAQTVVTTGVGELRRRTPEEAAAALQHEWPTHLVGDKVYLMTQAEPKRKNTCHVVQLDAASIGCKRSFGRAPRIYPRGDVAALILAGNHPSSWPFYAEVFGGKAGVLTGAFFLAGVSVPAAVVVGVVGVFAVCFIAVAIAFGEDDSYKKDVLVYQASGQLLQVPLK